MKNNISEIFACVSLGSLVLSLWFGFFDWWTSQIFTTVHFDIIWLFGCLRWSTMIWTFGNRTWKVVYCYLSITVFGASIKVREIVRRFTLWLLFFWRFTFFCWFWFRFLWLVLIQTWNCQWLRHIKFLISILQIGFQLKSFIWNRFDNLSLISFIFFFFWSFA